MTQRIGGRYELDREIGRGGMGTVWLARDIVLGRTVALKQIGVLPGTGQADLERVEREARVSAMLHHEHVVSVFDLVGDGDQHWLVMEYVESRNLAQLIHEQGPLEPDRVAALIGQAAAALGAAHRAGIVHRDVKPSNILVTPEGRVKLGDFGIARTSADPSLTQTGMVTGSPSYLAPEVAAGKPATEASDMWSLGATVFHAVAGEPPYDARENLLGALYRIVHEEPPRTDRAGWLAPLLDATMNQDPEARWSADRVAAFLRAGPGEDEATRIVPVPPAVAPPPAVGTHVLADAPSEGRRSVLPVGLIAGIVAAMALVLLVAWLVGRDPGQTEDPTASPPSDAATSDGQQPNQEAEPDPPSEEQMVAFVEDYLDAATDDPEESWPSLTPAFQEASGGFESYAGFWGGIDDADLRQVSADPEALTVSYVVQYDVEDGGRRPPENVTLQLAQEGDRLLIADEF